MKHILWMYVSIIIFVFSNNVFSSEPLIQSFADPPIIKSIIVSPEKVTSKDEIKISIEVQTNDSEILEGSVNYSSDKGINWNNISLEQNEINKNLWETKLPPFAEKSEIIFTISLTDTNGNFTVEVPAKNELAEKVTLPFTTVLKDEEDVNEKALDITSLQFNYDDNNFYFKLNLAGTPPKKEEHIKYPYMYRIVFSTPDDELYKTESLEPPYLALMRFILYYSPKHFFFNLPEAAMVKAVREGKYIKISPFNMGTWKAEYTLEENAIKFILKREFIDYKIGTVLRLIAISSRNTGLNEADIWQLTNEDVTTFAFVYLNSHKIVIE